MNGTTPQTCTVVVGNGVRGELVHADGGWRVGNSDEIRTLMALGDDPSALDLVNAFAQTLNHGVIQVNDAKMLGHRLKHLFESVEYACEYPLSDDGLDQAVLLACANSDDADHQWFLGVTLLRRLAPYAVNGHMWVDHLRGVHWSTGHSCFPHSSYVDQCTAGLLENMPQAFWTVLRNHPDRWLRDLAVVTNPETTPLRLRRFAADSRPEILIALALHPNATAGMHRAMLRRAAANSPDLSERLASAMACNRGTQNRMLERLSAFGTEPRCLAAHHPNLRPRMLDEMLRAALAEGDPLTPLAVGGHPHASELALRLLAESSNLAVVRVVAANSAAPVDLLRSLLDHRHRWVRAACVHNPALPAWTVRDRIKDRSLEVRAALAERHDGDAGLFEQLAGDASNKVRAAVAANPFTPTVILRRLARDGDDSVRRDLAWNPHAPADVLAQAASDPNQFVRMGVAANTGAPPGLLDRLAAGTFSLKQTVARNPATDVATLSRLAVGDCWVFRWQVASNPSTPSAVVRQLVRDDMVLVRHAASASLRRRNRRPSAA